MLNVRVNEPLFEYDIHSLVKAFYPNQDVKVIYDDLDEIFLDVKYSFLGNKTNDALKEIHLSIYKNGKPVEECDVVIFKNTNRTAWKNDLKSNLYQLLKKHTGIELPWGTLTGIRPTKIPMQMLNDDSEKTDADMLGFMKETYLVSDEKGLLSIDIARREKEILSQVHYKDGYSLYIGIPFCPTTCLYCSFTSYPISAFKKKVEQYLQAVFQEIDFVKEEYKDKILDSVYIGGGTPTTLEAEELDLLIKKVRDSFDFSNVKEFTVEAGRADSITEAKLRVLKKNGVSRISVNPQTMSNETLRIIGRRHTVEQVVDAFLLARKIGFDNINMDLILGLPGENEEDVAHTIGEVAKLNPDSITVHSLAIKRASALHQWMEENNIKALYNTNEMMRIAAEGVSKLGMEPYYLYRQKNMAGNFENVGYAKPGKYGLYNILIMEEVQTIVAIGAGTVSKLVLPKGRIERCDTVKDVDLYIEKIDEMIRRKRELFSLK